MSILYEFVKDKPELMEKLLKEIQKEVYINKVELEKIDDWEIRNEKKEYKEYWKFVIAEKWVHLYK